ncbi:mechanosensitive ion channel [Arcobacteraceae bacterium]|nr:mechanosensitive ion channel [Arcobacteraceae bacterium]
MKNIIKYLFILTTLITSLYSVDETKESIDTTTKIVELQAELNEVNKELERNIWITRYNNYLTYRKIEKELVQIRKDAKKYGRWKGEKYKELSYQLNNKIRIKENELEFISEYKDSPIGKQITPAPIGKAPSVTNPFSIIEALSYIQILSENVDNYNQTKKELVKLADEINQKINLSSILFSLTNDKIFKEELDQLELELKNFNMVVDIVSTTEEVYGKKVRQTTREVKDTISEEVWRTGKLLIIMIVLFLISFGVKIAVKKYIEDDDKHYSSNKLINFVFIVVIVFILLFSYIDNVSYLVTILGFASAGIAIALKDWFMSMFGWMAIMTSGAIGVGDRIKVVRDGVEVVGDVLDITLFKIAVREDITLTSYMKNRRTGRVIFIPNNYIFTDMIANYTFDGLRTVWDGIDIHITFESNHKKAVELAKAIVQNHAKGYTDLTKKRLQKMRKKYVLRSANPEPRIFAFAESYSIVISSWYYTNSHATLALRSTISMEILEAFKSADDITIAYPTQTINVARNTQVDGEHLIPNIDGTKSLFDS